MRWSCLRSVDTFLFDKTGTLTRERPEVGRVLTYGPTSEQQILQWAAAAEQQVQPSDRQGDPRQVRRRWASRCRRSTTPSTASATASRWASTATRFASGSARFMTHEGIVLPADLLSEQMDAAHEDGNSLVMVGVDDALGGAHRAVRAERPEAAAVIAGLRARGAKHLAIISGDHEQPTRKLAERLGMDRTSPRSCPQDKAKYVELLQKEGRTVCFIGDGVNDSIALKKANVSISLRGASSVATDTAQVVFMEDSLIKLLQLHDVSRDLQSQHQHQLGADRRPQSDLHRRRLLRGLRCDALDGVQPDRRNARARQRPLAAAEGRQGARGQRTAFA